MEKYLAYSSARPTMEFKMATTKEERNSPELD
jgi:hypothetical protein